MIVVERQPSAEHHVEDNTARPDVNLGSGVEPVNMNTSSASPSFTTRELEPRNSLSRDDLGRGVIGTPAGRFEEVAIAHNVGESEIGNLDVEVFVEEKAVG